MSTLDWTPTTISEQARSGAVLEATAPDGAVVRLHLENWDDQVRPSFTVTTTDGSSFDTDSTRDWPRIERYVARSRWPEPMYVGKHPLARHPDKAVSDAVNRYQQTLTIQ